MINNLSNLKIEAVNSSHINSLCEIEEEVNLKNPWSKRAFLDELNKDYAYYYVAKQENIILGFIGIWVVVDECHIVNLAVKKAFQKQGIASILLKKVLETIKKYNLSLITLEVRESNLAAQRLYEKFGFKKIALRKNYYSDYQEDGLIMSLSF